MDELPTHARIAIVGGGFAGLATAWALAEAGHPDVVVLEREARLAGHASSNNAAMCRALAEDDAWTAITARGAAWLGAPPAGFSPGPLVDGRGAILLTRDPTPLTARAARHGVRAHAIGVDEVNARWPGVEVDRGGVWFPDDGCIDLAALTAGYVDGARRRGVRMVLDAAVTAIGHDGRALLTTARGELTADVVVAAGGAWSGPLAALVGVGAGFVARKRHLFALRLDVGAAPIVWNVDDDEWYARPSGGGVLACACDHTPSVPGDVEVDPEVRAVLRARLPAALRGLTIERAWACQRTFAADGQLQIGWATELPWWCWVAGLGGHGVTASPEVGRRAAAALLSRR